MFKTVLMASLIALGLSGAAMARGHGTRHGSAESELPGTDYGFDQTVTGSIYSPYATKGVPSAGPTDPFDMGPCTSNIPGPDGNAVPYVNDHYCGK
ncbi:hypothetical protein ATER59S_01275 [Aquamicrobium terrae]